MQLPLQITFRNMDHSDPLEKIIRTKAAKLDTFADHIMGCRVVIEPMGKHHQHGNQYSVKVDVTLAGGEIVVSREPSERSEFRDVQVAIRDAFDAVYRQVEDFVRKRRGFVKALEQPSHAKVVRLFPKEDYGFLVTPDGREIYFHRNSVLNDAYDDLQIGAEVSYVEEEGKKGPQASTVKVVGRHHHA